MISLGRPGEPIWLDLRDGVRVKAALHDPVAELAATGRFGDTLRAQGEHADMAAADLEEIVELGRRTITDWEGVGDEEGHPAPCTPDNIELLLRYISGMAIAFRVARNVARARWIDEKKGSSGSRDGTTPAGRPTAGPVH